MLRVATIAGKAGSRARIDEPEPGRLLGIRAEPEGGRPYAESQLWLRGDTGGPAKGSSNEPTRLYRVEVLLAYAIAST